MAQIEMVGTKNVGSGMRVRGVRMVKLFKAHVVQRVVAVVEIDRIPAQDIMIFRW